MKAMDYFKLHREYNLVLNNGTNLRHALYMGIGGHETFRFEVDNLTLLIAGDDIRTVRGLSDVEMGR